MVLTKEQKNEILGEIGERLSRAKTAVFTNYQGLKVSDITNLRKRLSEKSIDFKVAKNSLLKKALDNKKIDIESSLLDKPLAIAYGYDDEVEPNKLVYQFSKENENLKVMGAIVNGVFMDAAQVKTLALLPSREQLYANVVGSIAAPMSGFVNVLAGNLRGLVSVLDQYKNSK